MSVLWYFLCGTNSGRLCVFQMGLSVLSEKPAVASTGYLQSQNGFGLQHQPCFGVRFKQYVPPTK